MPGECQQNDPSAEHQPPFRPVPAEPRPERPARSFERGARDHDGDDPWWAIAAAQPQPAPRRWAGDAAGILPTGRTVAAGPSPPPLKPSPPPRPASPPAAPAAQRPARANWVDPTASDGPRGADPPFPPRVPQSFEEAGLSISEVEALVLKFLLNRGIASGRRIAAQVRLPFGLVANLLRRTKEERLVAYRGDAPMSDYLYELTELGSERARRYSKQCTYFGTAPVPLDQYIAAIGAQSIRKQRPKMVDLQRAFADLVISREVLSQLGQAIRSGLGLFLYGAPGNGKSSIAERVTKTLGETIWIPRAISVLGELIRVYDPSNHQLADESPTNDTIDSTRIDGRWVRIRRPTIVVGGELTLDNLEVTTNPATGISEAPLQMKANGGVLVIDDFGRQRARPAELLNRWIVPLEKRYDFLNLSSGRKIQVPLDELIIFSTNLEPKSLVDEAFLRRIPYKIDVRDPTEEQFRTLCRRAADMAGIEFRPAPVEYLIERYYKTAGRAMRFCHPRDLVHHMHTFCSFHEFPLVMTKEAVDAAVRNYFSVTS